MQKTQRLPTFVLVGKLAAQIQLSEIVRIAGGKVVPGDMKNVPSGATLLIGVDGAEQVELAQHFMTCRDEEHKAIVVILDLDQKNKLRPKSKHVRVIAGSGPAVDTSELASLLIPNVA